MKRNLSIVLMSSIALFSACKSGNRNLDREAASSATADSATVLNAADTDAHKLKLVKTAEMQFEVKNVQKASEAITDLVTQEHGMVMNHHMETTTNNTQSIHLRDDSVLEVSAFTISDEMIVRVPQEQLVSFINQISRLSVQVNSMKMDVDDRTADYLTAQLKANNRAEVAAYQQKEKPTTKSAASLLALKDEQTDKQINNVRTDAEVKYSTVSLNFSQDAGIMKQVVPNTDLSAYNLPFGSRLWMSLATGWALFTDLIVGLANVWVFLLMALSVWLGFRYYKRRQPRTPVVNI